MADPLKVTFPPPLFKGKADENRFACCRSRAAPHPHGASPAGRPGVLPPATRPCSFLPNSQPPGPDHPGHGPLAGHAGPGRPLLDGAAPAGRTLPAGRTGRRGPPPAWRMARAGARGADQGPQGPGSRSTGFFPGPPPGRRGWARRGAGGPPMPFPGPDGRALDPAGDPGRPGGQRGAGHGALPPGRPHGGLARAGGGGLFQRQEAGCPESCVFTPGLVPRIVRH